LQEGAKVGNVGPESLRRVACGSSSISWNGVSLDVDVRDDRGHLQLFARDLGRAATDGCSLRD
jgi:hypothetical protein